MFEFAENSNSKYSVASLNIPEQSRCKPSSMYVGCIRARNIHRTQREDNKLAVRMRAYAAMLYLSIRRGGRTEHVVDTLVLVTHHVLALPRDGHGRPGGIATHGAEAVHRHGVVARRGYATFVRVHCRAVGTARRGHGRTGKSAGLPRSYRSIH